MESEANGSRQQALCLKGCGFYGSPAFNGMCSKCHKNVVRREEEQRQLASEGRLSSVGDSIRSPSSSIPCRQSPSVVEDRLVDNLVPSAASPSSPSSLCGRVAEVTESLSTSPIVDSDVPSGAESTPKKAKKARCHVESCRARLGLTGFDCRCGHKFCSKHRYSDEHNCDYDYKADGRAKLEKSHQACRASKVDKL